MRFRDDRTYLRDILASIALIEQFVSGMSLENYRVDAKTSSAVERQLQILTEAAKILGPVAEELCPGLDWRGFRGMGDLLRHAYHRIDDQIIWDTIRVELLPMKTAVQKALLELERNDNFPML